MSKVTISVDTKTNSLEVTIDGEKLDAVECIYLSKYEDYYDKEPRVSMDIRLVNQDFGDMRKHVTLTTANSKFAKENASKKIDTFKDFEVFRDHDFSELEKSAAVLLGRKIS